MDGEPHSPDAGGDGDAEGAERARAGQRALQRLHRITADPDSPFDQQVRDLLAVGREYLGVDIGFFSRIDGEEFAVVEAVGDHEAIQPGSTAPLSETYCRRAVEADGLVGVRDASDEWAGDPAYERFGLGCYLGGKVVVDGDLYGTFCFADAEPRDRSFDDGERTFVELAAEWLSGDLERRRYREELEAARERFETAMERVDDAFFAVDAEWRFTYVNDRAAEVLRAAAGDVEGDLLGADMWAVLPEAVGTAFHDAYHRAMETQEPVVFEEQYDPLGAWFEVRAYPSADGLSVYFTDITERKRRESALDSLLEWSQALLAAETTGAVLDCVGEATADILDCEASVVRRHEAGELVPVFVSDEADELMADRPTYAVGEGLPGRAFEAGETRRADRLDSRSDHGYGDLRSALAVPLGEYGTLSAGAAATDAFDEADVTAAELLASSATVALQRAERQARLRTYESVFENVEDMVFAIDESGRFTVVTPAFAERLGYDRDGLVGAPAADVFADDLLADGQRLAAFLAYSGHRHRTETEAVAADGDRVPVEVAVSLLPGEQGGTVGVVRDISELAATRRELRTERDRFESLFEHLPDPATDVRLTDDGAVIEGVNAAFEAVFGYDRAEVVGRRANEILVPEDRRDAAAELDERAREGEVVADEVRRRTADGRRYFLFKGVAYGHADGDPRAIGTYTDITDQRRRELQLKVLNRVLRHNLRNELNLVLGIADRIAGTTADADTRENAEKIVAAATELAELSEKARDIEAVVRDPSERRPVDVGATVRDVAADYPEVAVADDLPAVTVRAGDRLAAALVELVENAIEHGAPPRRVEADAGGGWVTVRVLDRGPGVPEGERAVVTGAREISQLEHGSGLGLWVVRWAVDACGGEFDISARADGGTAATLRFPVE